MKNVNKVIKRILDHCDLLFEENVFSKEVIIQAFMDFLSMTSEKEKHNVGIVLHTGSVCYDAVMVVYVALMCLLYNKTDTDTIISSLKIGDIVSYGDKKKERYSFGGYTTHPMDPQKKSVLLTKGNNNNNTVPQERWRFITPYNGKATALDGRGIRKKNGIRDEFYKSVLDFSADEIPNIIDTSVVFVTTREHSDYLINNISIRFDEKEIKLLELVTASYYTEEDEYPYGGNAEKMEPVLKITGKVSVARNLIHKNDTNKNVGIIILGNEIVFKGISELPEMMNRRSLQFVYVAVNIDSEKANELINATEKNDNLHIFACTKKFLLSKSIHTKINNKFTLELSKQVDAVLKNDIQPYIIPCQFTWSEYSNYKNALYDIKKFDYESEEKTDFIINAFSLTNLFLTAVFKIKQLDKLINEKKLELETTENKLQKLNMIADILPEMLREKVRMIINYLETAYLNLVNFCEKENYLIKVLIQNHDKKVAIIVPKAYYIVVMRESNLYNLMDKWENLTITTANRFDNTVYYDRIIVLGNYEGKRFNTFRCRSSQRIETILYEFELNVFYHRKRYEKKMKFS